MSAVQLLRVSVHERIRAAAEHFLLRLEKGEEPARVPALRAMLTERLTAEIVAVFEETVAEYEDRVERSEREVCRQRRLLDAVMKPEVRLHKADLQQVVLSKAEVPPELQQWSPLVDQEDPEPLTPPHIKEEQKELRISQEGEQLEEADIIKFTFTPVAVKSEEDEETPQLSQLHQSQTEENRANCRGPEPEPAGNSGPEGHFHQGPENKTSNFFEPVAENRGVDWRKTRESPSCFNTIINKFPCNTPPTVRLPQGLERILANVGYVNGELLYRVPAASPLVAAASQAKPLVPQKRRRANPLDDSRPYIKKPPNAFMLFRKEERLKVVAELNNANSAAVNTIIGQRSLSEAGRTGGRAVSSYQSSKEENSSFKKKTGRKKKEPQKEKLVKISVGIMQRTEGRLRAVRGMVLPFIVRPLADAEELLEAAKQTMKDFITGAPVGPYVLLFADAEHLSNMRDSEEKRSRTPS
ncbi:uncharacterized protein LOC133972249 isoform X2 [Platichthys flesus]|uniref:uncharacterized protein LOC133972249 isoform X2 n=1 Tax=Platichthys flesus TaxID=8260 RepID=UPI002DBC5AC1|nr:uncharacterized protein LOC133972249 isoform X2 [Platichthys flesus]